MTVENVAYSLVAVLFALVLMLVGYIWRTKNTEHDRDIVRIENAQNSFKDEISKRFDEITKMIQDISGNPEKCGMKFATKDAVARAWKIIADHEERLKNLEKQGGNNG